MYEEKDISKKKKVPMRSIIKDGLAVHGFRRKTQRTQKGNRTVSRRIDTIRNGR